MQATFAGRKLIPQLSPDPFGHYNPPMPRTYRVKRARAWLTAGLIVVLTLPVRRVSGAETATRLDHANHSPTNASVTQAEAPYRNSAPPARTTHHESGGIYWGDFGSVDSADAAVAVFVLASVVVVSAAVLYSGALLANLILQPAETEKWIELSPRAQFFSGGHQQGTMTGAALTLGLVGDGANVGLALEGGYLDADVITVDSAEVEVAGGYGMGGLSIRWPFDNGSEATAFEAELLVGSAHAYDLISRASFALTWNICGAWRAGVRVGALYLDVEDREGPVREAGEDFNLLGGLETSVRF